MTEEEWLTATNPMLALEFMRGRASERKLRLLGVACARASWDRLEDQRSRRAVETAERYADGAEDASALEAVVTDAWDVRDEFFDAGPASCDDRLWLAEVAALTASVHEWRVTFDRPVSSLADYPFRIPSLSHCVLLRDIFGNPFRPVTVDRAWLTSEVRLLATGIYAERAFDRMPILADALQDAGCDSNDLLTHLRDPHATHVRGCWALDLVLGKE